jgi:two-component system phosphate regulon sensor histidine kinase PhoR
MDSNGNQLIVLLVIFELIQLITFWFFFRRKYWSPLWQLSQLTEQIAAGQSPKSYFIDGPPLVEQIARALEVTGIRLEDFQRQQKEEDFNLNVLLANMVEGVMIVDHRRVVRLVNRELLNLFGLKQSPLQRTVLESLRESRVELIIREAIQSGEIRRQEVTLESPALDNSARHFEVNAVPIRTKEGEVGGAVVVFHDITRIKQLEMIRSEFVANVSHELRTPLSIFRGYLETLTEHRDLPREEFDRILEAMARHSNRLNALVEDLLILTRLEARQIESEFTTIEIDAFFQQIVQDWKKRKDSGDVTIEIEASENLPPLEVDTLRFEQVILNLLENSVAYSNPPRRVVLSAALHGGQMELRVTDNGMGIPPRDLPHIFERFYRVDKGRSRVSGGTGLGLSIVKHIMQSHQGSVYAESEQGKGTTIVLRLPLHQGEPPETAIQSLP